MEQSAYISNMPSDIDDLILATLEGPNTPPSAPSETPSPPADVPNDEVAETQQFDTSHSHGPTFFYRRRDEWVKGNYRPSKHGSEIGEDAVSVGVSSAQAPGIPLSPAEPNDGPYQDHGPLERLGEVLSRPHVIEDEDIWEDYLKSIHSKLLGGSRLKKGMSLAHAVSSDRLPVAFHPALIALFMTLLTHFSAPYFNSQVKILHAGWLRDGTWAGATETPQFSSTSNPTSVARVNQTMWPFRTIPDGRPSAAYAACIPLACHERMTPERIVMTPPFRQITPSLESLASVSKPKKGRGFIV